MGLGGGGGGDEEENKYAVWGTFSPTHWSSAPPLLSSFLSPPLSSLSSLMDGGAGALQLCFPSHNASCLRVRRPPSQAALLYTLVGTAGLLTSLLNLLVIVSIAHFRQLHTPTNTLLLSLAVCDLLVGALVMPVEGLRYVESCWLLGRALCTLSPFYTYCLLSASVGNLVLVSLDRYLAVCQPLHYHSTVTMGRVRAGVCGCWLCSVLYNGLVLEEHLARPLRYSRCYGDCVVVGEPGMGHH